ncbi:MAG: hypothetical protein WKF75_19770 [Singulisphaera sp.]
MIAARFRLPALALCLVVTLASTAGAGEVRVTIWEGLPSPWDWNAPSGQPDDTYDTPAMGFSHLPAEVNARGIEIDRIAPFAVHAEAILRVPAGLQVRPACQGVRTGPRRRAARGGDRSDSGQLGGPRGRPRSPGARGLALARDRRG